MILAVWWPQVYVHVEQELLVCDILGVLGPHFVDRIEKVADQPPKGPLRPPNTSHAVSRTASFNKGSDHPILYN